MLVGGPAHRGSAAGRIRVLEPLALPDRIDGQHDEPFVDQIQDHVLIRLAPVGLLGVPAEIQNGGCRPVQSLRHEERAGDVEARHGLVDEMFDPVSIPFERIDGPGPQRRSLGKRADLFAKARSDLLLPPRPVRARSDRSNRSLPIPELPIGRLGEVTVEDILHVREPEPVLDHAEILLGRGRRADQDEKGERERDPSHGHEYFWRMEEKQR